MFQFSPYSKTLFFSSDSCPSTSVISFLSFISSFCKEMHRQSKKIIIKKLAGEFYSYVLSLKNKYASRDIFLRPFLYWGFTLHKYIYALYRSSDGRKCRMLNSITYISFPLPFLPQNMSGPGLFFQSLCTFVDVTSMLNICKSTLKNLYNKSTKCLQILPVQGSAFSVPPSPSVTLVLGRSKGSAEQQTRRSCCSATRRGFSSREKMWGSTGDSGICLTQRWFSGVQQGWRAAQEPSGPLQTPIWRWVKGSWAGSLPPSK